MNLTSTLILAAAVSASDTKLENDVQNVLDSFLNLVDGIDTSLGKAIKKTVEENKPQMEEFGEKLDDLKESVKPHVDEAFDHVDDAIE